MAQGGGQPRTVSFGDPVVWAGVIGILALYGWFAWFKFHAQISMVYTYIRTLQWLPLYAIGKITHIPPFTSVVRWIENKCEPVSGSLKCSHEFQNMLWRELADSSQWMNVFCLIVLGIWCVTVFMRATSSDPLFKHAKVHNVTSFMKESSRLYSHLRIFSRVDLIKASITDALFGMSLTSRQFMQKHKLVTNWEKQPDKSWQPVLDGDKAIEIFSNQLGKLWNQDNWKTEATTSELMVLSCVIPRVAATDVMLADDEYEEALKTSDEMVELCWSFFKAPPEVKKAPAKKGKDAGKGKEKGKKTAKGKDKGKEIATKADPKNKKDAPTDVVIEQNDSKGVNLDKGTDVVLVEEGKKAPSKKGKKPTPPKEKPVMGAAGETVMAPAWLAPDIDREPFIDVIESYIDHSECKKILKGNAYTRTLLFSFFEQARRLGVFQPAQFRWLRFFDRDLWYVIDDIGRRASFAESAGVKSHWLYEMKAGKPLYDPMVEPAVEALRQAVCNYKYLEPLEGCVPDKESVSLAKEPAAQTGVSLDKTGVSLGKGGDSEA